jgi:hypothetical protein
VGTPRVAVVMPAYNAARTLGTEGWQARMVRCLVGAFILACGLAAFWLVPAFAHNNLRGPLTGWKN